MDDFELVIPEYYFDKTNGVIVSVSSVDAEEFQKLKDKVADAIVPLIKMLRKAEQDNPTPVISRLHWALLTNVHFFGKHQKSSPAFFDKTSIPNITLNQMADVLSQLVDIDNKTAYDFLLKLNACKAQCYIADLNLISSYEKITSIPDFLKKMEVSIGNIIAISKEFNPEHRSKVQKRN
jgi:hypothetical protein